MNKNQFRQSFPKWLKKRRSEECITQEHLSCAIGLTKDWISHFENGRRLPDAYAFWKIEQKLGHFNP